MLFSKKTCLIQLFNSFEFRIFYLWAWNSWRYFDCLPSPSITKRIGKKSHPPNNPDIRLDKILQNIKICIRLAEIFLNRCISPSLLPNDNNSNNPYQLKFIPFGKLSQLMLNCTKNIFFSQYFEKFLQWFKCIIFDLDVLRLNQRQVIIYHIDDLIRFEFISWGQEISKKIKYFFIVESWTKRITEKIYQSLCLYRYFNWLFDYNFVDIIASLISRSYQQHFHLFFDGLNINNFFIFVVKKGEMSHPSFSNLNVCGIQKITLPRKFLSLIFFSISLHHIFLNIYVMFIHEMDLILHQWC